MKEKFIYAFLVLALAGMACGINIDLPKAPTPGPLITDQIAVPVPKSGETRLKLSFGAGDLTLSPGAEKNLVEGTAIYNYDELKPVIKTDGSDVTLQMGDFEFKGIPALEEFRNEWDFKLSPEPMELVIEAGAYDATYEFGGLSLTDLSVTDGAAAVELSFSQPNRAEMTLFRYESGASNVRMDGLANANFSVFNFSAGAGDYTLEFSGDMQRDATVNIETGFSNVILVIPEAIDATVTVESGVSNINAGPGWVQNGDRYVKEGQGPRLVIVVEMSAGNLTLSR